MANINKFSPVSPDTFLKAGSDMALAKFGHLNAIVDAYNTLDTAVTFGMPVEGVVTTNFSVATSTTLTAVTGLSTTVVAGGTYIFRAYLPITVDGTNGIQIATNGTATWTSINQTLFAYTGVASTFTMTNSTTATPGTLLLDSTTANTLAIIEGTVKINAAGTLGIQICQKVSGATAAVVKANASFTVTRVS
jgi:hypothetical protein